MIFIATLFLSSVVRKIIPKKFLILYKPPILLIGLSDKILTQLHRNNHKNNLFTTAMILKLNSSVRAASF